MASSRKPPVPRDKSAGAKPAGARAAAAKAAGTGVISASKSVPGVPDSAATGAMSPAPKPKEPGMPAGASILAFPEPKGKKRRRNVLLAAGIVAAVTACILVAAIFSPVLAIRTVTVSGTKLLTANQVQASLQPLQGVPLPQVAEGEVRELLAPLVQVKDVKVEARPPSELVVKIQERVPVAQVKQGEQYLLVDVEGVQLATSADPASTALPVIDGGAGAIGQELFQATAAVLGALPPDILARMSNASAQSVDAVELKLVDGQTVVWGNAEERELKAKVLQALLQVPADPKNPVRIYDVSAPRNPVTR
ncbi:cell division protein FtsQ/DivIB [Pseudarthrobacter sp. J64]|uniref:cell division protein FtsQ/DivIB n=1 Tax=Pseudarthrobacter sp. J64 TaxID=3116485 RepID=UPI003FA7D403